MKSVNEMFAKLARSCNISAGADSRRCWVHSEFLADAGTKLRLTHTFGPGSLLDLQPMLVRPCGEDDLAVRLS